jgi:hypothetical protein
MMFDTKGCLTAIVAIAFVFLCAYAIGKLIADIVT